MQANTEIYQRNIQLLEKKLKTVESELEENKEVSNKLRVEYENYKVKAQHAFKRQKEQTESTNNTLNGSSETQKFLIDIEQLKQIIKNLNLKQEELVEKIKLLEKENELMQDEYSKALERNTKLLAELKEKETEWKNK